MDIPAPPLLSSNVFAAPPPLLAKAPFHDGKLETAEDEPPLPPMPAPGIFERAGIALTRHEVDPNSSNNVAALMGMSARNPITGAVEIKLAPGFKDFVLVDLYTRSSINGSVDRLAKDPYLFRPVPLMYRTWIYHHEFLYSKVPVGADEFAIVKRIFNQWCVDAPVHAGRWASVMCFAPMAMFLALVDDMTLLLPALLMVVLGHTLATNMNTPLLYRYTRFMTVLPRLAFYVWAMLRFVDKLSSPKALTVFGFFGAFCCAIVDLVNGDLAVLVNIKMSCKYKILGVLPNRIFICQRLGAAWLEEKHGYRGDVSEAVVGFSPWQKHHMLLADIQGCLMELQPLNDEDWETIYDQNVVMNESMSFLGLDIFSDDVANATAVQEKVGKTLAMMAEGTTRPRS
mmetsp:Transcript_10247/g.22659  ORF Transcript_10247/g.22659 Transcript_10247/m.22659 type:complete len:399 (-) Transcript_10247:255-1451(-)